MFCKNCGKEYDDSVNFCVICGQRLVASAPPEETAELTHEPENESNDIYSGAHTEQLFTDVPEEQTYEPENLHTEYTPEPVQYNQPRITDIQPVQMGTQTVQQGASSGKKALIAILSVLIVLLLIAAAVLVWFIIRGGIPVSIGSFFEKESTTVESTTENDDKTTDKTTKKSGKTSTTTSVWTTVPPSTASQPPETTYSYVTGESVNLTCVVNTPDNSLNMRKYPDINAEIVDHVRHGRTVIIVSVSVDSEGRRWGKTTYEGNTGWIAMDYVVQQ